MGPHVLVGASCAGSSHQSCCARSAEAWWSSGAWLSVRAGGRGSTAGTGSTRPSREPDEEDQREEQHPRHIENVIGGEHEGLCVDQAVEDLVALVGIETAPMHRTERRGGVGVTGAQPLDELRMMERRPAVPDRRRDGSAEGAGSDAREVEKARGCRDTLRWHSRE